MRRYLLFLLCCLVLLFAAATTAWCHVREAWRGGGFDHPGSVSVNPADGSCWVADFGSDQVIHLASDGSELGRAGGFDFSIWWTMPNCISVNPADGACWVADPGHQRVVKLSPDCSQVGGSDWNAWTDSVSVNPTDGTYWVATTIFCAGYPWTGCVGHMADDGTWLSGQGWAFNTPISVSVNPTDGSCWVADEMNHQVVHLASDSTELWRGGGFSWPWSVSVNPVDGSCWVASTGNGQVVHLAEDGGELWRGGGFTWPCAVSVSPLDGSCWVADQGNGQVVQLAQDGTEMWRGGGFNYPQSVSVNPTDGSCWVADTGNNQVVHLVSGIPMVTRFDVYGGRLALPDGAVSYEERAGVTVRDMDGAGDIASVTVTDSQDRGHEAEFVCDLGSNTAVYCWLGLGEQNPMPAGTYTATVTDLEGNADTASAEVPAIPNDPGYIPTIESPPANYSVATSPPTFSWSLPMGSGCYCLRMWEEEGECAVWCPPGPVSSPLPYDGSGSILPGHLYGWNLDSYWWDVVQQSDPRAHSNFLFHATGRFWVEPKFVGFLEPINNDGSSIFKLGSTVPVKFRLLNANGSYRSDAVATLSIAKLENDVVGTYQEAVSTAAAYSGSTFRYDPSANQYIFNLGTRNLSTGTWSLQVTANGVVMKEVLISLK